jgi:hypothetical protein
MLFALPLTAGVISVRAQTVEVGTPALYFAAFELHGHAMPKHCIVYSKSCFRNTQLVVSLLVHGSADILQRD